MSTKNKRPRNKEGQRHGLWELYYPSGQLYFRGNYINGKRDGLWEWYYESGKLDNQEYCV